MTDGPAATQGKTVAPQERRCRFCETNLSNLVLDLGVSPLANSNLTAAQLQQPETFYPLRMFVCTSCFLVQLEDYQAPEEIFSDYVYFSSYSESWLQHARSYTEMAIDRFHLNAESRVVEVASNDGYLLQYFLEKNIPVLGVEPAANVAEVAQQKHIPTLIGFFGEQTAKQMVAKALQADLIVGNNVLAHVPKLNDFVCGLKIALKSDGVITLEFPHLLRLIEENQFDTVYHEHFSYFSISVLLKVFGAHHLTIFDVDELPTHGGSLRVYVRHTQQTSRPIEDRVYDLQRREENAGLNQLNGYIDFGERVKKSKRMLLEFLVRAKNARKAIVAYGAPAKGNTLLNYCGLRTDFIDYTVDRSPHKQGLFLPGTHIPVLAPDAIRETRPDYVLILPWNLKNEIVEQMSYIRSWGGQFVVPIPSVEVLC